MPTSNIQIRPFQPDDSVPFRDLNERWINKYFGMEEQDRVTLDDPLGHILEPGGHIFMAFADEEPIGTCALIAAGPDEFEVAKMTVAEEYRGQGVGRKVLEYTIGQAKALGAKSLRLETNAKLANAIHLYESVGFRHAPPVASPYTRANVFMDLRF
jgi:putative acetyltransferase